MFLLGEDAVAVAAFPLIIVVALHDARPLSRGTRTGG